MPRRRNVLSRSLSSVFTRAYLVIGRRLPLAFNRRLAILAGRILARLVPRVRRVAMENLDRAYGDSLTPAEKERIYWGAVDSVALVAAEFPHLDRIARGHYGGTVSVDGEENMPPHGQGCLFVGAHMGNWELMGPFIACARGYKVAEVVRPFDDPKMDRAIDDVRRRGELTTIPKDNAGREIVRLLKEGYLIGILIDQSPRENGVPVMFFDAPCWATVAPVMIAVRARVPIVPVALTRNAGGYTLRFYPAIEMARSGNLRADLVTTSQACQDAMERIIRERPEQWLWLHRRWKERPRLAEEWARKQARDK